MAEKTIHLKRTSLYASGASPVNMIQAIFYNEDMLIYDLEDSVPAAEKDAARFLVYNMVKNHRPKDKYVCIRVNGIYSEYLEEDLQAAVRANPDCIRIPKVEYAREVQDISRRIAAIEEKIGLEVGKIELICNIESYMGVINAMEIAHSDPPCGCDGRQCRGPDCKPEGPENEEGSGSILCEKCGPHGMPFCGNRRP